MFCPLLSPLSSTSPKNIPQLQRQKKNYINPRRLSVVFFAQDALTDIIADTGPLHIPGRFLNAAFVAGAGTKPRILNDVFFHQQEVWLLLWRCIYVHIYIHDVMSIRFFSILECNVIEYSDFYLSIFTHGFTTNDSSIRLSRVWIRGTFVRCVFLPTCCNVFFSEVQRFAGSLRASAHGGFTLAAYGVLHQVEPLILHPG